MKQHDEQECDARDLRALELLDAGFGQLQVCGVVDISRRKLDELLADIEADERKDV